MLVVNEGKSQTKNNFSQNGPLDELYKLPYSVITSLLNCELKKSKTIAPPFSPPSRPFTASIISKKESPQFFKKS